MALSLSAVFLFLSGLSFSSCEQKYCRLITHYSDLLVRNPLVNITGKWNQTDFLNNNNINISSTVVLNHNNVESGLQVDLCVSISFHTTGPFSSFHGKNLGSLIVSFLLPSGCYVDFDDLETRHYFGWQRGVIIHSINASTNPEILAEMSQPMIIALEFLDFACEENYFEFILPIHLRYHAATTTSSGVSVILSMPLVFLTVDTEDFVMDTTPKYSNKNVVISNHRRFITSHLGIFLPDQKQHEKQRRYQLISAPQEATLEILIPIGSHSHLAWVTIINFHVLTFSTLLLVFTTIWSSSY